MHKTIMLLCSVAFLFPLVLNAGAPPAAGAEAPPDTPKALYLLEREFEGRQVSPDDFGRISTPFTVEITFRPKFTIDSTVSRDILRNGVFGDSGFKLAFVSGRLYFFGYDREKTGEKVWRVATEQNRWEAGREYRVTAATDGYRAQIWVDGKPASPVASVFPIMPSDDNLHIGHLGGFIFSRAAVYNTDRLNLMEQEKK